MTDSDDSSISFKTPIKKSVIPPPPASLERENPILSSGTNMKNHAQL